MYQSLDRLPIKNTTTNVSKMKSFIVLAVLVASALAGPVNPDAEATIVSQQSNNIGVDGYSYSSQTSNGISASENGQLKNVGTENEALVVSGEFSYYGDDGVLYKLSYVADEEGFKPVGDHLPRAQR